MKISTEIASASGIVGEERAIELIAKAGFDAWDFSMIETMADYKKDIGIVVGDHPLGGKDYAKFAKKLRKVGEDFGIHCNQSHAPFPTAVPGMRDYLLRAFECTAIAGGEICVIHPCNCWCAEQNAEMYFELLPFAKEHGVKIATENMFNWTYEEDHALPAACSHHDDFLKHVELVNDPYLVACVDIEHAEMEGLDTSASQMIRTLGKHVQALHIHDNDKRYDSHRIIGQRNIDFAPIVKALSDIGYDGYFTLECNTHIARGGFTPENVKWGVRDLADKVRGLANEFERLSRARK